jgi:hypothetical protein
VWVETLLWTPVQEVLPKYLKGYIVSEVNCESSRPEGLFCQTYKNLKENVKKKSDFRDSSLSCKISFSVVNSFSQYINHSDFNPLALHNKVAKTT